MSAIHWRQRMSVGQPVIDGDHKHLIELLNQLDATLSCPSYTSAKVAKVLLGLMEYTHDHFAREEKIMQQVNCPRFEEHRRLHIKGVQAVTGLANEFNHDPSVAVGRRLYAFTAEWLVNHIIMEDTQLTPYVRGVWL